MKEFLLWEEQDADRTEERPLTNNRDSYTLEGHKFPRVPKNVIIFVLLAVEYRLHRCLRSKMYGCGQDFDIMRALVQNRFSLHLPNGSRRFATAMDIRHLRPRKVLGTRRAPRTPNKPPLVWSLSKKLH
ncbi:hypothetical protein AVEN_257447-1 [Araneus ventricosus]|uniref:Uncharacterized protein n=1 Tax=Araneus ventricosus TaxID=182803 RepID=A0A4Y2FEK0_ARAVE|nr:hypothetical protein AVEN_257447-1 [Araneus ventricosus]